MVVVVLVMRMRRRRGLDCWEAFEIEEAAELEVLPKDVDEHGIEEERLVVNLMC